MSGKPSLVSLLESRKQLLIAESELNRAQLSEEWQTMTHGVRDLTTGPRPLARGPRRRRCWWPGYGLAAQSVRGRYGEVLLVPEDSKRRALGFDDLVRVSSPR